MVSVLLVSCKQDQLRNTPEEIDINSFFESLVHDVEDKSLLENFKSLPLEKAIHGGSSKIFVNSYKRLLNNKDLEKTLKNYLLTNDIDTSTYYTYCVINAHFHQYLNGIEVDIQEIKAFVAEHQYDY